MIPHRSPIGFPRPCIFSLSSLLPPSSPSSPFSPSFFPLSAPHYSSFFSLFSPFPRYDPPSKKYAVMFRDLKPTSGGMHWYSPSSKIDGLRYCYHRWRTAHGSVRALVGLIIGGIGAGLIIKWGLNKAERWEKEKRYSPSTSYFLGGMFSMTGLLLIGLYTRRKLLLTPDAILEITRRRLLSDQSFQSLFGIDYYSSFRFGYRAFNYYRPSLHLPSSFLDLLPSCTRNHQNPELKHRKGIKEMIEAFYTPATVQAFVEIESGGKRAMVAAELFRPIGSFHPLFNTLTVEILSPKKTKLTGKEITTNNNYIGNRLILEGTEADQLDYPPFK